MYSKASAFWVVPPLDSAPFKAGGSAAFRQARQSARKAMEKLRVSEEQIAYAMRLAAASTPGPNQRWSMDLVQDQMLDWAQAPSLCWGLSLATLVMGGCPNALRYSRLNWVGLEYPTLYAAEAASVPLTISSRRASFS